MRARAIALLLLLLLVLCAACGADTAEPDAAACIPDAAVGAFGAPCTAGCECTSGVCFLFGDGTHACTLACTDDTQCPTGSRGQKCNGMGVCRP
jgi:hypothetical protein